VKTFTGKTIWITGASSGIGEALAKDFAARGAILILSARNQENLHHVKQQLINPEKHLVLPLDLAEQSNFPELVKQAINHTNTIDMLVNNGGISQRSLAIETAIAVDRKIMEVDYFGAVALTKAILPHMIKRRSGTILSISSVAGKVGIKRRTAYCAAKHALIGFMDALRAEIFEYGIKVCVVSPGFVRTNISINALTGDQSALGVMDDVIENGMDVDVFSAIVIKALEKGQDEILIARGMARLAYHVHRLLPNLYHALAARSDAT